MCTTVLMKSLGVRYVGDGVMMMSHECCGDGVMMMSHECCGDGVMTMSQSVVVMV